MTVQLSLFSGGAAEARHLPIEHTRKCRVLACPEKTAGELCTNHDTPAIRAMRRPASYVFEGRRIVLESRSWEEWESLADAGGVSQDAEAGLVAGDLLVAPPLAVPCPAAPLAIVAKPCWEWCGQPRPRAGEERPCCHPASLYGRVPALPCLACGREFTPCRGHGVLLCSPACVHLWTELRAGKSAELARAWLFPEDQETWQERAAVLEIDGGLARREAEAKALVQVWRELTRREDSNPAAALREAMQRTP